VTTNPVLPYVWMLCGSLAFALMGSLAHVLGAWCDWQAIAVARSVLPLVLVALLAAWGGVKFAVWKPGTLWVRSLAGSVSMMCTFFALTRLPVSDVFTLTNMFPLWVAVLSWPLLNERPPALVWLSIACGAVGVVLIQQPHFAAGNFATLVALAGSFFTAVAVLGLHRLRDVDVRAIVVHFSAVALLCGTACFFVFEHGPVPQVRLNGWAVLLLGGVGVSATVGQLFLTKAFAAGPPDRVSVVGLTQVVFAALVDVLLFERRFQPEALLGMALILAPTAWLMLRWPAAGAPWPGEQAEERPLPDAARSG
jgi:drug/metabolite transporter (DMT)-like permease